MGSKFVFTGILSILAILLFSSCISFTDPMLEEVPEFEVREFSFVSEKDKRIQKKNASKTFIMRWNILGPLPAISGKNITQHALEGENLLCGSVDAPDDALWHVRIFDSRKRRDAQTGLCNWTKTLSKYKKQSLFYGCSTLNSDEEYKNVTLFLLTAGEAQIYLNGKCIGTFTTPNLPGKNEYKIESLTLKKGANRLVLKYLDKKSSPSLRGVAVRFTMQEKAQGEKKIALIR